MQFKTLAIHSHQHPDPVTGAVINPIYQTSTFAQEDAGVHKGWDYSRCGNPTVDTLAAVLADLEGGKHGYCFSSGVGALVTMCNALFKPGDHLLIGDDVYGGTFRYTTKVLSKYGVEPEFIDMTNPQNVEKAIRPNTRMVYMESPTNPLLKLVDIEAITKIAQKHGITTCVDNTFASPYLQSPIAMGVDIVLHSTTKYIGGHSDVIGGALILKDDTHNEVMRFHRNTIGANPDPFNSWLTLRGLKTLGVRMDAHCASALELARFLENHERVETVFYPGLPSHPHHALANKQMKAGGGMISIRVKGGEAEARKLLKAVKVFTLAESLGGVESLIEHPASMTHLSVDPKVRQEIGITDNLVRLSVGIEDVADLKADLEQALKAIAPTAKAATV
ncbi:MAG: Cystathionine gamma-lyase [Vampirovibrio sp.]|jgi:cystathionine beta-lyase/cystathionine gamma-synthase|nr:Cystathionine gamma-lyase [Vampirovibrio sp.]